MVIYVEASRQVFLVRLLIIMGLSIMYTCTVHMRWIVHVVNNYAIYCFMMHNVVCLV